MQGKPMTGRLVKITLVLLLAGCMNFTITRDTDPDLSCEQIEEEMDWVGWDGFIASLDPLVRKFKSSQLDEAVEERKAHLLKIAQEKGCAFVDRTSGSPHN